MSIDEQQECEQRININTILKKDRERKKKERKKERKKEKRKTEKEKRKIERKKENFSKKCSFLKIRYYLDSNCTKTVQLITLNLPNNAFLM